MAKLREKIKKKLALPAGDIGIILPPQSHGSQVHTFSLLFGMHASAVQLGVKQDSTPLSIIGPGATGSVVALAADRRHRAVLSAMSGSECLFRRPFASVDTPLVGAADGKYYEDRFDPNICRFCKRGVEDVYHLACVCENEVWVQAGDALLESLPQVVGTIWKGCCEAIAFSNDPPPVLTAAEQQALNDLRGGVLPPTDERNFITYWLLLATPWPRSVAVRAGFPAAAALGALFDATNVRPALLRRMAAAWLTWSENALNENLGPTWQAACATGKYPVVNGPPRVRLPKPPRAAKRGKPLRRRDHDGLGQSAHAQAQAGQLNQGVHDALDS